jgi:hypothetical protein
MSKAAHTPGPWNVEPLQWDHGASIAIVSKGEIICTIAPENEDEDPDMTTAIRGPHDEANAALIAAAPEQNAFIRQIARMTMDGENDFVMENDDAVSTLNALIEEARNLETAAKGGAA